MLRNKLDIIVEDLSTHPHCAHGPTLLFQKVKNGIVEKYFACSACRDRTLCPFYMKCEPARNREEIGRLNKNRALKIKENKFNTLKEVKLIAPENRCYCKSCQVFFPLSEMDKHASLKHVVIRKVDDEMLKFPSTILAQQNNDKKEAQYFFDSKTIDCVVSNLLNLKLNKIICIGAPTLHEHLTNNYETLKIQSILLDIDRRFSSFYDEQTFFWYNMFNNYFFDGEKCRENFKQFLSEKGNDNVCIFTDPPFACRTEPLTQTLKDIGTLYRTVNTCNKVLPIIWIFPYFMETYIHNAMPELIMLDYQINYTNHKTYHNNLNGRKQGSPVRLFTNILPNLITLPTKEGYRFCDICSVYVAVSNKHCAICNCCPSKNGSTYKHCRKCTVCVKPSYRHCDDCGRCAQIAGHKCDEYRKNLMCWICRKSGHAEKDCSNLTKITKTKRKLKGACFLCENSQDHNVKNCTKRKLLLGEDYFLGSYSNKFK